MIIHTNQKEGAMVNYAIVMQDATTITGQADDFNAAARRALEIAGDRFYTHDDTNKAVRIYIRTNMLEDFRPEVLQRFMEGR